MDEDGVTLDDIAKASAVEARTLRSWVGEGLLAPPLRTGRGARYPESNIARALAVRALKDAGLSLAEIRRRLLGADPGEIAALGETAPVPARDLSSVEEYLRGVRGASPLPPSHSGGMSRRSSWIDPATSPLPSGPERGASWASRPGSELPRGLPPVPPEPGASPPVVQPTAVSPVPHAIPELAEPAPEPAPAREKSGIEALLTHLETAASAPPARRGRATTWRRIPVTPDVEISVRGDVPPREMGMLERIADLLRAILTGGSSDDDRHAPDRRP